MQVQENKSKEINERIIAILIIEKSMLQHQNLLGMLANSSTCQKSCVMNQAHSSMQQVACVAKQRKSNIVDTN